MIVGCGNQKEELNKISELETLLIKNEENLKIDEVLFNARIAEMDEMLEHLKITIIKK